MTVEAIEPKDWGVLVAQLQRTTLVGEQLTEQSVEHFIPKEEVTTIRGGRPRSHLRPMLGRYVLYVVSAGWKNILSLRGVAGILMATDYEKEIIQPLIIDPKQLKILHSLCIDGIYSKTVVDTKKGLVYGQTVTPHQGPFAYHIGKYDGLASHSREAAIFKCFGREQKIMFKTGILQAA